MHNKVKNSTKIEFLLQDNCNVIVCNLYRSALRSFKRRVAYANANYDRILLWWKIIFELSISQVLNRFLYTLMLSSLILRCGGLGNIIDQAPRWTSEGEFFLSFRLTPMHHMPLECIFLVSWWTLCNVFLPLIFSRLIISWRTRSTHTLYILREKPLKTSIIRPLWLLKTKLVLKVCFIDLKGKAICFTVESLHGLDIITCLKNEIATERLVSLWSGYGTIYCSIKK